MCGISLAFDPTAPGTLVERALRMHAAARHRGPDGDGFLAVARSGAASRADAPGALNAESATLVAGFRRLRILDLSEEAGQPMRSEDGQCWIAFNGEIYDYRALREELRGRGRRFRTTGDTEVLLAAYQEWGAGCFERLHGMWAAAIVDLGRRRLVLSRDRFGIKPLHWSRDGTTLLVASETKQIVAAGPARPRANAGLVSTFAEGSRYPCLDESFFDGIHPVPPATWCEIPLDEVAAPPRFQPYWRLSDFHSGNGRETGYAAARERFEALLRAAVRSHTVADVRVGALLSGGLDSSTIAALLAREGGRELPTFSFGVRDGDPRLCELPYAEAVARAHGLVNHQAGLDADWVRGHAPAAIRALEEPPLALAALAQYRTFQLCREHGVTVVLDGQAADEVLGGYPYHQRLLLADRLRRGRWREMRVEMGAIGRREGVSRLRLLAALAVPPLARRMRRRPPWLSAARPRRDAGAVGDARADRGRDPSALNRQLYWDVKWGNVKVVLGHTDRTSMAHSVEARVPYLDPALVEFAFGMPDDFKVGDGQRKRVLRDTARALLPPEVTDRPDRMGFALATGPLMRALAGHAREAILDAGVLSAPCFDRPQAHLLLERFAAGDDAHAAEVWRLYALALWAREFDVAVA